MGNLKELDYLKVLKAIDSMPFKVGKNLLLNFLAGLSKNESIKRNGLDKKELFGYFELYSREEIEDLIENLIHNGLMDYSSPKDNKFMKIIVITPKGKQEMLNPALYKKKLSSNFSINQTEITENDKMVFAAFDFFLKEYNDEQKKAIISDKSKILCVAGAGSGKTTVLTKRIEFLTAFKTVDPKNILAITFTRKARTEMISRLSKSQYCNEVSVETFNSFCEKVIRQYNDLIYKKDTRVVSYPEKVRLFRAALKENNIAPNEAIDSYFSFGQRRDKTSDELLNMLMNDCYTVLELYKSNNKSLEELNSFTAGLEAKDQYNVKIVYSICRFIDSFMVKAGLRDYSDQLMHCIQFLKNNSQYIPKFEYVLVDEYQDVNSSQIELLDILNPKNLFCVGDPRQSIFGWRGSKIRYILNFEEKYPDCKIITLSTNYRSSKQIVELINNSMESARLPELKHFVNTDAKIHLLDFESESEEMDFVIKKIIELIIPRKEIFVLARTNRIISELSSKMKVKGIKHLVKTEETSKDEEAANDQVTLATVHSIKGLEADTVFLVGCTGSNFPCKAADHPIIELVKIDEYDKEEEERRLFYVALSRAKHNLYLTYSGKNHTRFISAKMLELINGSLKEFEKNQARLCKEASIGFADETDAFSRLKTWRRELSQKLNVPPYLIMHDKTLLEIISMNPLDVEDLINVKGIGPAKLERYGKQIIGVLRKGK